MDNELKHVRKDNDFVSETDPEGFYTGNPTLFEVPEQDVDDL